MRLLLVEDEKRMAQALCELLSQEFYEVDHYEDGIQGLSAVESGIYDVIILDVMLPGMNGCKIVQKAREKGIRTPVLMLTALSELEDKVEGLDSGADDYLTKPFMAKELLARLRALLRRNMPSTEGRITYGDICLDTQKMTLGCVSNEQEVRLSEKEYRILEYLMSNQGQILTREQLVSKIWGLENEAEYNNVEVYMSFTRKKLAFVDARTQIKAVRGVGYELRWEDV